MAIGKSLKEEIKRKSYFDRALIMIHKSLLVLISICETFLPPNVPVYVYLSYKFSLDFSNVQRFHGELVDLGRGKQSQIETFFVQISPIRLTEFESSF